MSTLTKEQVEEMRREALRLTKHLSEGCDDGDDPCPMSDDPAKEGQSVGALINRLADALVEAMTLKEDDHLQCRDGLWFCAGSEATIMRLEAERDAAFAREKEARAAEKETSDAYLRVRQLLGAWDTAWGGADRFEVTEGRLKALRAENEALRAHRCGLPDSINEALNSGDGTYKP